MDFSTVKSGLPLAEYSNNDLKIILGDYESFVQSHKIEINKKEVIYYITLKRTIISCPECGSRMTMMTASSTAVSLRRWVIADLSFSCCRPPEETKNAMPERHGGAAVHARSLPPHGRFGVRFGAGSAAAGPAAELAARAHSLVRLCHANADVSSICGDFSKRCTEVEKWNVL